MAVELRFAESGDYARISAFLDQYWARNHVYVRSPQLFQWTFGRNQLWDRNGYSFALAEDQDEVVGVLGGIPFNFNCLARRSRGVWFANYMVRSDYRRGSLALRLMNMFCRPPFSTSVAFGVNPTAIPLYQALRWRVLSEIPRHFCVLPQAEERLVRLLSLSQPGWPTARAQALARAFRVPELPAATTDTGTVLPPQWDKNDWPIWAARTVGAARESDYLRWRYINHPCFAYHVITVPQGGRNGLLIWRLELMRRATPNGLEDIDRLGRIVEFLPTSRENAKALLAHLWQALLEKDALGADYYGYHGEIRGWLHALGFRAVQEHQDGLAIPSRFQPLDGKGGRILSALLASDEVPTCSHAIDCLWYWTKSDADQDRPN